MFLNNTCSFYWGFSVYTVIIGVKVKLRHASAFAALIRPLTISGFVITVGLYVICAIRFFKVYGAPVKTEVRRLFSLLRQR